MEPKTQPKKKPIEPSGKKKHPWKVGICFICLLIGCAHNNFKHTYADGSSDELSTWSLWSKPAINGLVVKNAASSLELESATNDEVTGQQDFNKALPKVAKEVVKGVIEGLGISNGNPGSIKEGLDSLRNIMKSK